MSPKTTPLLLPRPFSRFLLREKVAGAVLAMAAEREPCQPDESRRASAPAGGGVPRLAQVDESPVLRCFVASTPSGGRPILYQQVFGPRPRKTKWKVCRVLNDSPPANFELRSRSVTCHRALTSVDMNRATADGNVCIAWRSTTARAARAALIRLSRFSLRSHRENRAIHLLSQIKAREGTTENDIKTKEFRPV